MTHDRLKAALHTIGAPDEVDMTGWPDPVIRGWAYAAASTARDALEDLSAQPPADAGVVAALREAVARYGKPGGPWNVPSDPGGWLSRARAALAQAAAGGEGPRALTDVAAERRHQVEAEGWVPALDDTYTDGELGDAAASYALSNTSRDGAFPPPVMWPWGDEWWKSTTRRRDMVKAGALILAEIERLDRAEAAPPAQKGGAE